jgi:hypothetical protein
LVAFRRRDRCDSSNQLKRPIWSKWGLSASWNSLDARSVPFRSNSILTEKECATCPCI